MNSVDEYTNPMGFWYLRLKYELPEFFEAIDE